MCLIENRHAVCLVGENSAALEEYALEQARLLLCGSEQAKPCDNCNSCKKVQNNVHPDVIRVRELMPESKYKVGALREIAADAITRPNDGEFKVYIFTEAESMRADCQNTLLKFTEEPPEYVRIIFTVKSPDLLLETVKSRLMFISINAGEIAESKEELREIAKNFVSALVKNNEYEAAAALAKIKNRDDLSTVLDLITKELREKMNHFSVRDYAEMQKILEDCTGDLKFNPNIALICTHIAAGICKN